MKQDVGINNLRYVFGAETINRLIDYFDEFSEDDNLRTKSGSFRKYALILIYCTAYFKLHGAMPSAIDVGNFFNISRQAGLSHLRNLIKKGYVKKVGAKNFSLTFVRVELNRSVMIAVK